MKLTEATERQEWDVFVENHPDGHPLQLWAWGEVKRENGWTPLRLISDSGQYGAQMLLWPVPGTKLRLAYVPRGPLGREHELLSALSERAAAERAIYLRIEPAWEPGRVPKHFRKSRDHTLLSQTYTVDLTKSEEELLEPMRHKTRQYIRKAENDGVTVEEAAIDWFDEFWRIYTDTAKRAKFALHKPEYYRKLWEEGGRNNLVLLAMKDGQAVAFLWLLEAAGVGFELYGGVVPEGAAAKANYLLKWEAIRRMKQRGSRLYDFNGRLNEGVSQFKAGFGADETDWIGTLDRPLRPLLYWAWILVWPLAKRLARMAGR